MFWAIQSVMMLRGKFNLVLVYPMVWTPNFQSFYPRRAPGARVFDCFIARIEKRIQSWEGICTFMRLTSCFCRMLSGTNLRLGYHHVSNPVSYTHISCRSTSCQEMIGAWRLAYYYGSIYWHEHTYFKRGRQNQDFCKQLSSARYDVWCNFDARTYQRHYIVGANMLGKSEKHNKSIGVSLTSANRESLIPMKEESVTRPRPRRPELVMFSICQEWSIRHDLEFEATDLDADMIARVEYRRALTTN